MAPRSDTVVCGAVTNASRRGPWQLAILLHGMPGLQQIVEYRCMLGVGWAYCRSSRQVRVNEASCDCFSMHPVASSNSLRGDFWRGCYRVWPARMAFGS